MKEGGAVVNPQHGSDWIVPRRVMCAFFWVGIVLLFTGIILLVTSKHKEEFYQSWGAILLGLGFCLLLICFILCLHAYCVITVSDDEIPNVRRHPQTALGPAGFRQRAPLKEPPSFKIPSSEREGDKESSGGSRQNYRHQTRLKTISENGSPNVGVNTYGATGVRADHIRSGASRTVAPPSGGGGGNSNATGAASSSLGNERSVHYSALPPSVTILSLGGDGDGSGNHSSANTDAESGYQNSTGTPSKNDVSGSVTFSLHGDDDDVDVDVDVNDDDANVAEGSSSGSSPRGEGSPRTSQSVPMPIIRDIAGRKSTASSASTSSLAIARQRPTTSSSSSPSAAGSRRWLTSSRADPFAADLDAEDSERFPSRIVGMAPPATVTEAEEGRASGRRGSSRSDGTAAGRGGCFRPAAGGEAIAPEHRTPIGGAFWARPPEGVASPFARPVVGARVTRLPSERQQKPANGAPLRLTYSRQYPISSVHAYPSRQRKYNPYTPLRVQIDPPDDDGDDDVAGATFRPMPPISEAMVADQSPSAIDDWPPLVEPDPERQSRRPPSREIIRPFDRTPSNLLGVQSSSLFERGLSNSANVYLSADQEFSESKMSIYDNVNYIRI